jgi:hypothetical protein
MKSFMFAVLVAIVAFVALAPVAKAQGYTSAASTFFFTVAHPLEIAGSEDLDLGIVTQGQCYTYTPDGYTYPPLEELGVGEQVLQAWFELVDANPGDQLQLDFLLPPYAVGETAFERIALSDWSFGYDPIPLETGQFSAQGPINGPVVVIANPGALIYMGLKACVPVGAQADVYHGAVILEAHYLVNP